jgi:hypothetical protein
MASILRLAAGTAVFLALLVPVAASGGSTGSGLYGTVKKGPITPVCSVDKPCDAPAQVTLVFTRTTPDGLVQSRETWRVRSTEQGKYRLALEPGFYLVRSTVKIGLTKLPKPHAVHVRAGHWDRINLFFDTGIR